LSAAKAGTAARIDITPDFATLNPGYGLSKHRDDDHHRRDTDGSTDISLGDAGLADRSAEQLFDQGADAAENRLKYELGNKMHVRLAPLALNSNACSLVTTRNSLLQLR
jgi:hypothetical protein